MFGALVLSGDGAGRLAPSFAQEGPSGGDTGQPSAESMTTMTPEQVEKFARLALAGIDREYPNKPQHVMTGPESVVPPSELHPVFHGHFDWHSSVHGHWMLVRLLRLHPEAPIADEIRRTLDGRFTREGLQAEADYFDVRENRSFERMYGWGWAIRLALELRTWPDPDAERWSEYFAPLENRIVELALEYLPKLDWPVRCGFHPETAFPMAQLLDYARATRHRPLEELVLAKARQFYGNDRFYPVEYEPSGNDFFSAALNEADLMRRVLARPEFVRWLGEFLPSLREGRLGNLLEPVSVSDVTDGHLVHLAGLNLSRAWTMRSIAAALPEDANDPTRSVLQAAAERHAEAGLGYVDSGHYEGDHWLASFAVYLLTGVGVPDARAEAGEAPRGGR